MITAMQNIVHRDLMLAMRRKTEVLTTLFFFIIVISLFPLGIGSEKQMLVKIAPDLDAAALEAMAAALQRHAIDGVIATNTTLARESIKGLPHADQAGGLSGAPLATRSTEVVRQLHRASLLQVYTGLIYRGPGLVNEIITALESDPQLACDSTNSVSA